VAHVPAFGYATYLLSALEETPKPASAPVSTDSSPVLENSLYRMEVNLERGGTVEHLILKHHGGRDMVDSTSAYAFGELRGYFGREGRFCSSVESPASIDSVNRNSLEQSISLTGQIAGMLFHKTITMREGSPLIDVSLTIRWNRGVHIGEPFEADWREPRRSFYDTRYMLSVLFPAAVRNPVLSKDAPFDVCESHQPTTFFNRWDSIRHNVLLHWADLASQDGTAGMTLFSDRTTSYSYAPDFPLALTLQYAGPGLWGRMYPTGAETSVRYALYPHEGQWEQARVEQYAEAWQEPLIAKVFDGLPLRNRSLLQTDCPHLEITTASASDGAFTFRLYNASRNASSAMLRLGLKGSSLAEEDLQGRELRRIPINQAEDGTVCAEVSLPPFGIRTYRLRYAAP
jgi:alpha-mannosidase